MAKIRVFATAKIATLLFVALFIFVTFNLFFDSEESMKSSKSKNYKKCISWHRWTKEIRKCVIDGVQTSSAWYVLDKIIFECVDRQKLRLTNILVLTNIDDTKLAIMEYEAKFPCTSITLGIGNNIHAERSLLNAMPQCDFFGADPIVESGQIFKNIGRFDTVAVGNDTWFKNATITINSTKHVVEVAFFNFKDYMNQLVNKTTVDFLFMDIAGYEYSLLNTFHSTDVLNEITICQITVELHGPPGTYGMTRSSYDSFVYKLIKLTPFIPLWSKVHDRHTKVYLFNADSEYCIDKYVPQMCNVN